MLILISLIAVRSKDVLNLVVLICIYIILPFSLTACL
uniref:Uncharacterized protein n=1 Tax=Anguilla anguilla TaxID=7936 RepID=A0A0E9QG26_ANGAN